MSGFRPPRRWRSDVRGGPKYRTEPRPIQSNMIRALRALLPLPPHRPFDRGALRADVALEHDLLGLSDLPSAEVDALGEAQQRTLDAQAPAGAARKPQQRGVAVLRE